MVAVNPNTPQGLVPIRRLDGASWNDSLRRYFVPQAQTNALFVGDPVIKITAAADVNGVPAVDLAAAGTNAQITGVVCGFLGTCAAGAGGPVSFFGLSGTPGPAYRPATSAVDWYVLVNDDPEALFYVQSNDSGGIPTAAVIGRNANLASGTGSAYTGLSGWQMTPVGIATTNTLQLRIIGVLDEVDNVVGLAHCKFTVQINQHTELPHQAGI